MWRHKTKHQNKLFKGNYVWLKVGRKKKQQFILTYKKSEIMLNNWQEAKRKGWGKV